MREHVEAAHLPQPRPGQLSGFRRAVGTTRGRILVPVSVEHDLRLLLDLVVELGRHGYLMLDFVSVPAEADDPLVIPVLRALSEASCCRGVPSARWRLLEAGPPAERLLLDVVTDRPDLVCLPAARPGTTWTGRGDVAGELVRLAPVAVLLIGPGAVSVLSVPPVPPVVLRSSVDESFRDVGRRSDDLVRRLGLSVYRRSGPIDPERELVLVVPPADPVRPQ